MSEFWSERAAKHGEFAVFNLAHSPEELLALTENQTKILFPLLVQSLNGKEKVALDFGCGAGRFTYLLAELINGKAIGVDMTDALIKLAPASAKTCFLTAKESTIPIPDKSVDVVWIFAVFVNVIEDNAAKQAALEIKRVMSPGSLLFMIEASNQKSLVDHCRCR